MVISFLLSGYLIGAVMTLWVTNVQDLGHSAAMAALAGAVIGPFKTVGRFFEMMITRNIEFGSIALGEDGQDNSSRDRKAQEITSQGN